MKFVSAVTALVAALSVGSEAAKPNKRVSRRELNQRMKNGQIDKATIMSNAKPHNEAAKKRKLDGGDYEMDMSGNYSVQFSSCFSLTTSNEELTDGDDDGFTLALFSQGSLMSLESYAIFKLCYGSNCSTDDNSAAEYVVDLNTYIMSLVNYLPDQMEGYCEACQENYDTCQQQLYGGQYGNNQYGGNYNNQNQNQQYNGYNNYGNRKLSELQDFEHRVLNDNNQVVRQLDCQLCAEYNCLNDDDSNGFESASEWLQDVSECMETGVSYKGSYQGNNGQYYQNNNNNDDDAEVFAGMICNGDGSGVEIGIFYDDECKLYLPNESYANYMSYNDATYQSMTAEIIEFTFSSAVFSCKEENVVYTTQDMSQYNGQYNQNYNYGGDDDDDDVAEWCEDLVSGDISTPVDMYTCGAYNYNAEDDNEDKYEQYNEQYQNYDQNEQYNYNMYSYEISEDYSLDMGAVCKKAKQSSLHTYYNTNNGNMYSYTGSGNSETIDEFLDATSNMSRAGLSGAAKFGVIALVGVVAGAAAALYMRLEATKSDDKNVGLIDPADVETKGGEVA